MFSENFFVAHSWCLVKLLNKEKFKKYSTNSEIHSLPDQKCEKAK